MGVAACSADEAKMKIKHVKIMFLAGNKIYPIPAIWQCYTKYFVCEYYTGYWMHKDVCIGVCTDTGYTNARHTLNTVIYECYTGYSILLDETV